MTGQAGVSAPLLLRAEFSDPDNLDGALSDGDTLTLVFDSPTNRAGEGALSEAGDRTLVDRLLRFSHSLGERYVGRWTETSVFVVTLVDTSGHEVPADVSKGGVSVIGDLKNENELSRWCKALTLTLNLTLTLTLALTLALALALALALILTLTLSRPSSSTCSSRP